MVDTSSFSQFNLCIQPTVQSPPKICLFTPVNFHLSITPLLVHKVILTIPTNNPFLYTLAFLTSLILSVIVPTICTKNVSLPQPFSQFRLREGNRELGSLVGSLVRIDTVLISPFFLKVWTVI